MQTLIAYIPVIHQGYFQWLKHHPDAEMLVLGKTITQEFRPLQKDIRALDPAEIVTSLMALKVVRAARVVEAEELTQLSGTISMPAEVVSQTVAQKYLSACQISFENIFLRWDSEKALSAGPVTAATQLDAPATAEFFMYHARTAAEKSADWWRQVGAVIVKDEHILFTAHNHHLPTEQQPYIDGDPRADFHKGDHIELSTAIHAEAAAIAAAAREGVALAGAEMYVTTFPCPNCAKLIAESGFKTLYFETGYSMLQGQEVLEASGVEIVQLAESSKT